MDTQGPSIKPQTLRWRLRLRLVLRLLLPFLGIFVSPNFFLLFFLNSSLQFFIHSNNKLTQICFPRPPEPAQPAIGPAVPERLQNLPPTQHVPIPPPRHIVSVVSGQTPSAQAVGPGPTVASVAAAAAAAGMRPPMPMGMPMGMGPMGMMHGMGPMGMMHGMGPMMMPRIPLFPSSSSSFFSFPFFFPLLLLLSFFYGMAPMVWVLWV
jgi:hypothetical protein